MSAALSSSSRLVDESVLRAWEPLERLRPSQWAERYVTLPFDSPIPGKLSHANAPYLPGIIDLCAARGVAQVNIQKAAQIGVSAAMRWLLGYYALHDPAPVGLVLPDKDKGREIVSQDVVPFFRDTDVLRSLMTRRSTDESGQRLRLTNGFRLHLMWAGSASSTASHPLKRVILDEVDKMGSWGKGGGEGHAVHRTRKRLRVYREKALQICVSTPNTTHHMIHQLRESSGVQLRFLVPCPHCSELIALAWTQVKWPHYPQEERGTPEQWADRVLAETAAWYECQACQQRITEYQRRAAIQCGTWGTVDEHGISDGRITRAEEVMIWPAGTTIGLQIGALYCTWETMHKLAWERLRAMGSHEAMFNFRTETLGEAFEETTAEVRTSDITERQKQAARREGVLPIWTAAVIGTIDTQRDHFYWVIRAWGPGMRSARIAHGRAETFEELDRIMSAPLSVEEERFTPRTVDMVLIDSGGTRDEGAAVSRTMEVYGWAVERPGIVRAVKGASRPMPGIYQRRTRGAYDPGGDGRRKIEVPLWLLDMHHYQDALQALIARRHVVRDGETGEHEEDLVWELNDNNDPEYASHMAAMIKSTFREGGEMVQRWKPVTSSARHDYRDCEGYQVAGAYMMQVHLLPPMEEWMRQINEHIQAVGAGDQGSPAAAGYTRPGGRPWFN